MGYCYQIGQGVQQSIEAAVYWYTESAEQGDAKAQTLLGYCYHTGLGVDRDVKKAIEWYKKAAAQGDESALLKLREFGIYRLDE